MLFTAAQFNSPICSIKQFIRRNDLELRVVAQAGNHTHSRSSAAPHEVPVAMMNRRFRVRVMGIRVIVDAEDHLLTVSGVILCL